MSDEQEGETLETPVRKVKETLQEQIQRKLAEDSSEFDSRMDTVVTGERKPAKRKGAA